MAVSGTGGRPADPGAPTREQPSLPPRPAAPPAGTPTGRTRRTPAAEPAPGGLRRLRGTFTVRTRILTWVVVLSALGLGGAGATAYLVETARIDRGTDEAISQEVEEFRGLQETGVDPQTGEAFTSLTRLLTVALQRNVPDQHERIVGFVGGAPVVFTPGRDELPLETEPAFIAAVNGVDGAAFRTVEVQGEEIRFAALEVRRGAEAGHYVVASFIDREHAEFIPAVRAYAVTAVVALALVAAAGWLVAGRLLSPLRALRRTAQRISDDDLSQRIAVRGADDVSELARTFNAMLDRLESAFTTQREFIDDAGHELRTPLTILRGQLELLDPDDPRDVAETRDLLVDEVDRMSRLVEELLLLAKAERPDFLRPERVDLGELVEDVVDKARALGPRTWLVDARPEAVVLADRQRLTQALVQLAQNAVKYSEEGATVAVGAAVDGPVARLWVRDTGRGLDQAEADRVFERFVRGGSSTRTEGSGLGLAIVSAIAAAHGGRASMRSGVGLGAVVELEIPVDRRVPVHLDDQGGRP
ncbi:sensor histidine kinase [Vallicoccus soli]|uniref:sensor histidine kinase n=1 Tax=Vallicoccus soli TaxID=2339232 RepID=UPI001059F625|nr:HAMP domain-containing sensor histidine kinase [Vallicoccus soli]